MTKITNINYKLPEGWYILNLGGNFNVLCFDINKNQRWIISENDDSLKIPYSLNDSCELHFQINESTVVFFPCLTVQLSFDIFSKSCSA